MRYERYQSASTGDGSYVLRKLISVDLFQGKPRKGFEKLNLLTPIKFNLVET